MGKRKMKSNRLIMLVAVLVALPSFSYAELYKWKDKNGQMQYTDTPPPSSSKRENISGQKNSNATGKQPLSVVANPAPAPATQKFIEPPESTNPQDAAAKIRQQNAEADKKNKQEKEAAAKLKAENCKSAKANYEQYAQGGRVYKMTPDGQRDYLDDIELKRGEIKARGEVSQYCN